MGNDSSRHSSDDVADKTLRVEKIKRHFPSSLVLWLLPLRRLLLLLAKTFNREMGNFRRDFWTTLFDDSAQAAYVLLSGCVYHWSAPWAKATFARQWTAESRERKP